MTDAVRPEPDSIGEILPNGGLRVVAPLSDAPDEEPVTAEEVMPDPVAVEPVLRKLVGPEDAATFAPKIAILGDVELRVDVVLGRARRTLQDLLGIRPSQTIELDRQRNSPVEILVNNKPFALGEIVVIDETNLGVRILEILDGALPTTGRS